MNTTTTATQTNHTQTTAPSRRIAITRYVPAMTRAQARVTQTATSSLAEQPDPAKRTHTSSRAPAAVFFPGAAFPPHRTGLRAIWTPSVVDRLQSPLTRFHE